jgi:hypothetical protein
MTGKMCEIRLFHVVKDAPQYRLYTSHLSSMSADRFQHQFLRLYCDSKTDFLVTLRRNCMQAIGATVERRFTERIVKSFL